MEKEGDVKTDLEEENEMVLEMLEAENETRVYLKRLGVYSCNHCRRGLFHLVSIEIWGLFLAKSEKMGRNALDG